jgi:hypothetical protein
MKASELIQKLTQYNIDFDVVFANREEDKLFTLPVECVVLKETDTAPFQHRIVLHTQDETDTIDDGECSID